MDRQSTVHIIQYCTLLERALLANSGAAYRKADSLDCVHQASELSVGKMSRWMTRLRWQSQKQVLYCSKLE